MKKMRYDANGMKNHDRVNTILFVNGIIQWDLVGMAFVVAALAITVALAIIYKVPMQSFFSFYYLLCIMYNIGMGQA